MKKTITLLLLLSMLVSAITGCNNTSEKSGDNTLANTSDTVSEEANPASDFEYSINDNNGITINKYIGTDTEVVIPDRIDDKAVTAIGDSDFWNNSFVVSVKMPDTVVVVNSSAFEHCTALTTVELSNNLELIWGGAFLECSKLEYVSLPDTLTRIGSRAFYNCTSLKQIKIPKSITTWGNESFVFSGLESVTLEEGLAVIGDSAFLGTCIKEIDVPSSIKTIPVQAFAACADLESITLNDGLVTIEYGAFAKAEKLKEITLPKTVETVTEKSFAECSSLEKVKFEGDAPNNYATEASDVKRSYSIYYHENANGFTLPKWNGYTTGIW